MSIIEIKNLLFSFPDSKIPVLNNISLEITEGEFVTICGKSGCGKTTLLRHLKPALTPHGKRSGEIYYCGKEIENIDLRTQTEKIGFVLQNPDNQIVSEKVYAELAFGLESLGLDSTQIRLRTAEMASFFGIHGMFSKPVNELSGGAKQLLNLASVMAMHPSVLVLDEPTSQLDPIAASEFLTAVKKLNTEIGTTVIISEHRLEEVMPMSDRVIVMDKGEIISDTSPRATGINLFALSSDMVTALPAAVRIFNGTDGSGVCPLTVREGRGYLNSLALHPVSQDKCNFTNKRKKADSAIFVKDVFFRYDRNGDDIISDFNLSVAKGTLHALLGGNGTGKTTALSLISGINKPYRGIISVLGKELGNYKKGELYRNNLAALPQNPQALFIRQTVRNDLSELSEANDHDRIDDIAKLFHIEHLLDRHPYDLSGGEQQKAALAKVLLAQPKILLLDEPTKGLDSAFKIELGDILRSLTDKGITILLVSHDVEFCAMYADVCSLFFSGGVIASGTPHSFFANNSFYTTAANRIARHIFPNAVTCDDVISLCKQQKTDEEL